MNSDRLKMAGVAALVLGVLVVLGVLNAPPRAQAQDDRDKDDDAELVRIGFEIAPVPLNLKGKNHNLVGLGSFIVNGIADCNGCHTGGLAPNFNYANNHNPYFGQPYFHTKRRTDPKTYLSGGTDFGPAVPASPPTGFLFYPWATPPIPSSYPPAEYGAYVGPDIITRNLTPDKTGRPEGGHTLAQFKNIMRTGIDYDQLHPTCATATPKPQPANCIPPPVDGSLLQVMPWPVFHNMTDHQLDAIYEYLKAIPCIEGPKTPEEIAVVDPAAVYAFAQLHNDCGDDSQVSLYDGAPDHAEAQIRARR
jgi:hypothetical protein